MTEVGIPIRLGRQDVSKPSVGPRPTKHIPQKRCRTASNEVGSQSHFGTGGGNEGTDVGKTWFGAIQVGELRQEIVKRHLCYCLEVPQRDPDLSHSSGKASGAWLTGTEIKFWPDSTENRFQTLPFIGVGEEYGIGCGEIGYRKFLELGADFGGIG